MARTYRGKSLDIARINEQNKHKVALGNANLNARGDKVSPDGKIVKTAEELAHERYSDQVSKEDLDQMNKDAKRSPKVIKDDDLVKETFKEKPFSLDDFSPEEVEPVEVKEEKPKTRRRKTPPKE